MRKSQQMMITVIERVDARAGRTSNNLEMSPKACRAPLVIVPVLPSCRTSARFAGDLVVS
jgi:hypothetical protein